MGHQTILEPEERSRKPSSLFFRQVKCFVKDSRELAALQWKVFRSDCRDARKQAGKPLLLLSIALLLIVSAMPLILAGIALSLQFTGLPLWCGLILVGIIVSGIALLMAWKGYRAGKKVFTKFETSLEEWNQNCQWIKKQFHEK